MNLNTFFNEKDLPLVNWELVDSTGQTHFISNEVVIEEVLTTTGEERKSIANTLSKIDFMNGDVNHFLKHLAQGLVNQYV